MRKILILFSAVALGISLAALAQTSGAGWRLATPEELKTVIPARAPVQNERIETEMRSASGVTDGKGKFIAGAVLITAGYSADGKYSHFFLTQVPIRIGTFRLQSGEYVLGWHRHGDSLAISFFEAATGKLVGTVDAKKEAGYRVDSFRMTPPNDKGQIFIGRFSFDYRLMLK